MGQGDMMSVLINVKGCHTIEESDMICVYPRNSAGTFGEKSQGSGFSSISGITF